MRLHHVGCAKPICDNVLSSIKWNQYTHLNDINSIRVFFQCRFKHKMFCDSLLNLLLQSNVEIGGVKIKTVLPEMLDIGIHLSTEREPSMQTNTKLF